MGINERRSTQERKPDQILFDGLVTSIQSHFWHNAETIIDDTISDPSVYPPKVTKITRSYVIRDAIEDAIAETGLIENPDQLFSIVSSHTTVRPKTIRSIMAGGSWEDWDRFKKSISREILGHHMETNFPRIAQEDHRRGVRWQPR